MPKWQNITAYSLKQIRDLIARGADRTDWAAVDRKSDAEVEAEIQSDPDAAFEEEGSVWVRVPRGYDIKLVKKSA